MTGFTILIIGALFFGFNTRKPESLQTPTLLPETLRTIKEAGKRITIGFAQCAPDQRRIDLGFGSTFIMILGPQIDGSCLVKYGGEVENPSWNGELLFTCNVPQSLGSMNFAKSPYGVDLSSIQQYCKK